MYDIASTIVDSIRSIETSSGNIANIYTNGYKSKKLEFLIDSNGPADSHQYNVNSKGSAINTSNSNDVYIAEGFFQYEKDGEKYNASSLSMWVDENGFLRSQNQGYVLSSSDERIFIGPDGFSIEEGASIYSNGELIDSPKVIDQTGRLIDAPQINKGFVEGSNVNQLSEIQIILNNSKKINTITSGLSRYDNMMAILNDHVGKI